jgi:hypothetical protein
VTVLPQLPKGIIRIRLLHTSNGKAWGTNFTVNMGSAVTPTAAQLNSFAAAVESEWKTQFVPAFHTACVYQQTLAEWHDGAGNIVVGSASSPLAGSDGGAVMPISVCMVISWRIAAGYRGGKPRNYLSGMTQHLLGATPNIWGTTILAAFTTAATHMLGVVNALTIGGATCTLGEISYFEDAAERAGTPPPVLRGTPLFRAFQSGTSKPAVGHQRLRDRP